MMQRHPQHLLVLIGGILLVPGCAPELSRMEGVSIKKYHGSDCVWWASFERGTFVRKGPIARALRSLCRQGRIISTVDLNERFACTFSAVDLPDLEHRTEAALRDTFGIKWVHETRTIGVRALVVNRSRPFQGVPAAPDEEQDFDIYPLYLCGHFPLHNLALRLKTRGVVTYTFQAYPMAEFAQWIEEWGKVIVHDESGLEGNYSFTIELNTREGETLVDGLKKIGLDLQDVDRPVEAWYVDVDSSVVPSYSLGKVEGDYQLYVY